MVLLLRTARHISYRVSRESVLQDLSLVHICLEVLGLCEAHDIVAMELLGHLSSAYQCLKQMTDDSAVEDKKDSTFPRSPFELNDASFVPGPIAHAVNQLVAATETPYQDLWV